MSRGLRAGVHHAEVCDAAINHDAESEAGDCLPYGGFSARTQGIGHYRGADDDTVQLDRTQGGEVLGYPVTQV